MSTADAGPSVARRPCPWWSEQEVRDRREAGRIWADCRRVFSDAALASVRKVYMCLRRDGVRRSDAMREAITLTIQVARAFRRLP